MSSYVSAILNLEASSANNMDRHSKFLLPATEKQHSDLAKLGIVFVRKVDNVLSEFNVSPDLQMIQNGMDPRNKMIINKVDNKKIVSVFLKNSGYNYYGDVTILVPITTENSASSS